MKEKKISRFRKQFEHNQNTKKKMLISRREGKLGGEKKFVYAKRCLSRTRTHLQRERVRERDGTIYIFLFQCVFS